MQSAFEKELLQLLYRLRAWLASHDRAVLISLILSIPPVPPVPFLGFLMALFNYRLWKQHKLENHEIGLIRWALILSTISSAIAIGLVFLIAHLLSTSTFESSEFAARIWDALRHYLLMISKLLPLQKHSEVVI
jgi:hypothetical protein